MHGGAPESSHMTPLSKIARVQQSSGPPERLEQPIPPQVPHKAGQQTLFAANPVNLFLHVLAALRNVVWQSPEPRRGGIQIGWTVLLAAGFSKRDNRNLGGTLTNLVDVIRNRRTYLQRYLGCTEGLQKRRTRHHSPRLPECSSLQDRQGGLSNQFRRTYRTKRSSRRHSPRTP